MKPHADANDSCRVKEECVGDNEQVVDLHTQHSPSHRCGIRTIHSHSLWGIPETHLNLQYKEQADSRKAEY